MTQDRPDLLATLPPDSGKVRRKIAYLLMRLSTLYRLRERLARLFMRMAKSCIPEHLDPEVTLSVRAFDPAAVDRAIDHSIKPLWPSHV